MNLQKIRAMQALAEIGKTKSIIKIVHAEIPATFINKKKYTLVFPRSVMQFNSVDKVDRVYFCGKMTPNRKLFIEKLLGTYDIENYITDSLNGRNEKKNDLDLEYFYQMSRSNYVACPDGDFIWTYRFFEAIFCKAIPIIENDSPLYDGYKFYRLGDKLEYRKDWVAQNLEKVISKMTI